jgi:hypothetical protein
MTLSENKDYTFLLNVYGVGENATSMVSVYQAINGKYAHAFKNELFSSLEDVVKDASNIANGTHI